MKNITLHVSGTHCASCKILIEDVLSEDKDIQSPKVDLKNKTVSFLAPEENKENEFVEKFNQKLNKNGYTFSIEKGEIEKKKNESRDALLFGLLFLFLFFVLQKSGILNLNIGQDMTFGTSFLVGLIASISSCLAVVGGLVLSLSAKVGEDNKKDTKNFTLFHVGRILSFAILGGALGALGSAIGINFLFTAILGILASLVMILLGLDLYGIWKNKITMSPKIFKFFRKIEHKTFTPLIIGFATFFLPCGFTQSMQVVALSSGSFYSGSMIMLFFALGTLPVLLFLSFGSASFAHSKYAPVFLKTVGVVVIGLGIFALLSGLAGMGIIPPLFNL